MNAPSPVVGRTKSPSDLGFPLFAAGQMLQHDDLAALAEYTRQITRLMMRSLFGCGVVCGLCVKASFACHKLTVSVDPGLALDCDGDPVHVPKATTVTVDLGCEEPERLWVVLRGFEKCCAPRPAPCSTDDDEVASPCTREQYWYEIQVRSGLPECVCGCVRPGESTGESTGGSTSESTDVGSQDPCQCADPADPCYADHYAGKCTCACPDCTQCACEWILLDELEKTTDEKNPWRPKHRGRRFVRPVLMRDPGCPDDQTQQDSGDDEESAPAPKVQARRSPRRKPGGRPAGTGKGSTSSTG